MAKVRWLAVCVGVGLSLSHLASGETRAPGTRLLSLTPDGDLQLRVPDSWRETRRPPDKRGVSTVELRPAGGGDFMVLVSSWRMQGERDPRQWVEMASRDAAPQSVEGALTVESLCGRGGPGWFFSATDKAPKPGEYRYMTSGALVLQGRGVSFTVLSNGPAGQPKEHALAALRELACHSGEQPPAAIAPSPAGGADLQLPDAAWSVHLDLPGFVIEGKGRNPETGGVMLKAHNHAARVILTAFIERAEGTPSAAECLAQTWPHARSRPQPGVTLNRRRLGAMEVGEFALELAPGMVNKHVNGYLGGPGGCVDVHVSKMPWAKSDDAVFDAVLRGVTLR